MKELGISVIITAYNRKEFLPDAIKSVFQQTVDGFSFEIVVVSNFTVDVSGFKSNCEIRTVLMDGTIGEFLYAGFLISKYDIVAFLDDDDTFHPDKLLTLMEVFSSNSGLCYYHNDMKYVDAAMHPVDYVRLVEKRSHLPNGKNLIFNAKSDFGSIRIALENRGDFNLSSITVRRDCYLKYSPLLKQLKSNPDGFFFWTGLISMGQLMIDNKKLTNYRIHERNVSSQIDFMAKDRELQKQIYTYDLILNFIAHINFTDEIIEGLKKWIYLYKYEYELMSVIFANPSRLNILMKMRKLLSIGMKYSNTLKYRVLMLGIMGIISVEFPKKFYMMIRSFQK